MVDCSIVNLVMLRTTFSEISVSVILSQSLSEIKLYVIWEAEAATIIL